VSKPCVDYAARNDEMMPQSVLWQVTGLRFWWSVQKRVDFHTCGRRCGRDFGRWTKLWMEQLYRYTCRRWRSESV